VIPVETVPGIKGGGGERAVEVGNSSMIYLIHCKNLCKCYNLPPPSTTIVKKRRKQIYWHEVVYNIPYYSSNANRICNDSIPQPQSMSCIMSP
jgi:hypothetical protein